MRARIGSHLWRQHETWVWFLTPTWKWICKSQEPAKNACYHLHNIRRIRKFLSKEATCTIILAFITSQIDHCNSLMNGLPVNLTKKLQRVTKHSCQNRPEVRKLLLFYFYFFSTWSWKTIPYFDGVVQDCSNSSELLIHWSYCSISLRLRNME